MLFVLNQLFDKYVNVAEIILKENCDKIFLESNYHHELFLLIANHFNSLSQDVQSLLISTVCNLVGDWKESADKDRLNIILRRRWLHAIKKSGYSLPNHIYNKNFGKTVYEPEHPEFLSYMGTVSWGEESLFTGAELLAEGNINNIIEFLNKYEGKNRFGETAIREAGQSLKEAIKSSREVFENNLIEFKKAKYEYWYYVIQTYDELLQEKKEIK